VRRFSNLFGIAAVTIGLAVCAVHANEGKGSTRYGIFSALDSRSWYGDYWFPEPFRAPEMDVDHELRVDWLHTEKKGKVGDEVTAEFEQPVGLWTFEAELGWERSTEREFDNGTPGERTREEGLGSVELSARHPVFQYVTPDANFDYTLAAGLEVAIPTHTEVSKDFEVVPQLFNLFRFGQHLSLQASAGLSTTIGPDAPGHQTLEYSAVLGWVFQDGEIPLPKFLATFYPVVEIVGERSLNDGDYTNMLTGTAGLRFNFDSIGPVQPRFGVGYVFPIDHAANEEFHWGIVSSLIFEF